MSQPYTVEGLTIDPARQSTPSRGSTRWPSATRTGTALVYLGTRFTFRWLRHAIDRFAGGAGRARRGAPGPGDALPLQLPPVGDRQLRRSSASGPWWCRSRPIYTAHELRVPRPGRRGRDRGVPGHQLRLRPRGAGRRPGSSSIVVTTLTELLPRLEGLRSGHLLNVIPTGKVAQGRHIHRFGDLLARAPAQLPPRSTIDPWRDLANIMYTGGTTGFPKGVPSNHATEVAYIRDVMERGRWGPTPTEGTDTVLHGEPALPHHGQGLHASPPGSTSATPWS